MTALAPRTFPAVLDSLGAIRVWVREAAQAAGLGGRPAHRLELAVDEIATNAIVHGHEEANRTGELFLSGEYDPALLRLVLEDGAAPFDPLAHPVPDAAALERPLEERPVGGLGILLAVRNVDRFAYERRGGRNRNVFEVRLR